MGNYANSYFKLLILTNEKVLKRMIQIFFYDQSLFKLISYLQIDF